MLSMGEAPACANNGDETTKDSDRQRAIAAVNGGWCGAGIRWPKAAEMGIKQKWEQCGYDSQKSLFSKVVKWVYFICTLHCSPVTSTQAQLTT